MQFTKRQIWAVVAALIGGGAIALQYLDSGPNVIVKYGRLLPIWAQDPKFIGIGITVLATGLVIALILAPWRRAGQDPPALFDASRVDAWILWKLDGWLKTHRNIVNQTTDQAIRDRAVLNTVESEIPAFLHTAMGKSEKAKYQEALAASKASDSKSPYELFFIAAEYLQGLSARELVARLERIREESKIPLSNTTR
jgi:hypothetical protein